MRFARVSKNPPDVLTFIPNASDKNHVDLTKISGRRRGQGGFVLYLMAIGSFALIGAVGLAVDMGLLFVAKNETQAYVDAGALAAALELDGTTAGLTSARDAVAASNNTWKLNTQTVTTATVEFATASGGPWVLNPSSANGYIYARVGLTVAANLYFMPIFAHRFTQSVTSKAVAGQIAITNLSKGASPYTLVSTVTTGPYFGLVQGNSYTVQWPAWNGNNPQCKPNNARKCYVKDPCANDSNTTMWAASQNWGSNINGYWGFGSNALIREAVLDGLQTVPIALGDNLFPQMTNGNKAAQAGYLDERARQDGYNGGNVVSTYLSSPTANGRRLMLVPILNPESPTVTRVLGFGLVLLYTNGASSVYYNSTVVGNEAFCAVYVGPYNVGGGAGGGGGGTTGASRVKLVE